MLLVQNLHKIGAGEAYSITRDFVACAACDDFSAGRFDQKKRDLCFLLFIICKPDLTSIFLG